MSGGDVCPAPGWGPGLGRPLVAAPGSFLIGVGLIRPPRKRFRAFQSSCLPETGGGDTCLPNVPVSPGGSPRPQKPESG